MMFVESRLVAAAEAATRPSEEGADDRILIYDDSAERPRVFHSDAIVVDADWNAAADHVAALDQRGEVTVWEAGSGKRTHQFLAQAQGRSAPKVVAFGPSETLMTADRREITLWNLSGQARVAGRYRIQGGMRLPHVTAYARFSPFHPTRGSLFVPYADRRARLLPSDVKAAAAKLAPRELATAERARLLVEPASLATSE